MEPSMPSLDSSGQLIPAKRPCWRPEDGPEERRVFDVFVDIAVHARGTGRVFHSEQATWFPFEHARQVVNQMNLVLATGGVIRVPSGFAFTALTDPVFVFHEQSSRSLDEMNAYIDLQSRSAARKFDLQVGAESRDRIGQRLEAIAKRLSLPD